MVEPISIVTGVASLLGFSLKAATELKELIRHIAIASVKIDSFFENVEGFTQVLRLMKETLEQYKVQSSMKATGHVGNHWSSLAKSIENGNDTLSRLHDTLERVNKSVTFLDSTRRHFRLQAVANEILVSSNQIRSYKETLQLSLHTVILWNQVTYQKSTDQMLPNFPEVQSEIRRVAMDLNDRIQELHHLIASGSGANETEMNNLTNLRSCVRGAASVVSSASTALGNEPADVDSEFGDCFPFELSEPMLRWMSSNLVHEVNEDNSHNSREYNELPYQEEFYNASDSNRLRDFFENAYCGLSQLPLRLGLLPR